MVSILLTRHSNEFIIQSYVDLKNTLNFPAYAFLHFITMFCTPVVWVNGYAYMSEIWDPKWRVVFTAFVGIPIGQWVLTLIAYLNR